MKKQLDIIQVFRGFAAVMVVIHHAVPALGYFQGKEYLILNYIAAVGKNGVDFFFVISGFIITYSNYLKTKEVIPRYLKNRFIRIYIPYLPIGIAMFLLYYFFPIFSEGNRDISAITSLTLIPDGNPALAVAWTLSFELFFYLLFMVYLLHKKMWNVLIFVWIAIILYCNIQHIEFENPMLKLVTSFYNLEFILGYLLAIIVLQKKEILNKGLALGSMFVLFALYLNFKFVNIPSSHFITNIVFSFFSFSLIYYYYCYKDVKLKSRDLIMIVGNASYSIYLVHSPLNSFIQRFLPHNNMLVVYVIYLVLITAVCVFSGYLYYYVFEKKIMLSVKNKLKI